MVLAFDNCTWPAFLFFALEPMGHWNDDKLCGRIYQPLWHGMAGSISHLSSNQCNWYPEDLWYHGVGSVQKPVGGVMIDPWFEYLRMVRKLSSKVSTSQNPRGKPLCFLKTAPLIVDVAMSCQALLLWGADASCWVIFGPTKHAIIALGFLGVTMATAAVSKIFYSILEPLQKRLV